jgi:hypothetical protein
VTLKWNDKEFKQSLKEQIAANAELVGQVVMSDARKNLLSITDPEWGAGHRLYVSKLLMTEVEVKEKEVEIRVGTRATPKSRHFGFYIETGSKSGAAHPWLRPAVFQNGRRIVEILGGK